LSQIIIAVDAMGGDFGPEVTVPAALNVLKTHKNLHLILVGDQRILNEYLTTLKATNHPNITIRHASQRVEMDEAPSHALRMKKDSSMRVAINLVKDKKAEACVSAGNTGALMATARFVLKTLPGIDRPAIIAQLPTTQKDTHVRMLDLGANLDSSADNLYQFAVMASVLTSALDNNPNPKVALLNIGEEEIKGNEQIKKTSRLLQDSPHINYTGYIEGNDVYRGIVDVVVCDGFVGNVALKTIEGVAKLIGHYIKEAFRQNIFSKLAGLASLRVLRGLRKRIDPARYNGATLIGLRGTVIKSHGSADILAFSYAIKAAATQVEKDVPRLIRDRVEELLK